MKVFTSARSEQLPGPTRPHESDEKPTTTPATALRRLPRQTSSSSAPVREAQPPPTTSRKLASTSCSLRRPSSPATRCAATDSRPRAVKQLVNMGIDVSPQAGWLHNKGLRIMGAGHQLQLHWPELSSFPDYGLVRPRSDFDQILATQAVKAGAHLRERTNVTGPILDERSGRIRVSPRSQSTSADANPATKSPTAHAS